MSERETQKDLDSAKESEDITVTRERQQSLPTFRVHFSVLSAKSLPQKNSNCCFPRRPLNPFAVFSYKKVRGKTSVEPETDTPLWNMKLIEVGVVKHHSDEFVEVNVFDKTSLMKNLLIGSVKISTSRLLEAGEGNHQRWLKIYKGSSQKQKTRIAAGEILIKFRNDRSD